MKRPIYFDDRERKLARVCLRFIASDIARSLGSNSPRYIEHHALHWLAGDVAELLDKFAEGKVIIANPESSS